ncbi:hypothetical protein E1B28_002649 [Marasmius oreades]|uniref:Uncharacterized protein n=1 Tax=Marasmius oreades TaxID=181124 RepID=A0A9P7RPJ2_9AGAR|nr:uncharacterized protein E1B28_002649 [Marasmius oreades]KAG7086713.1 hypothetical protein E1B28_002649 [Marasmius oreades]
MAFTRYGQSKLAMILYTSEIVPSLTSVSVHPGIVARSGTQGYHSVLETSVYYHWPHGENCAGTGVWVATWERGNLVNGGYHEPVRVPTKPTKEALGEELAKRLWEWTESKLKGWL